MEKLPFQLEGDLSGRAWPIAGHVHVPSCDERTVPVVALAHGWLGHERAGPPPALAEALARSGFAAVTFNFSGSGFRPGEDDLRDDARFGANSFAREVDDLERVVTAIFERVLPGRERFDIRRIGAAGHDSGAGVALVEAARDSRVKAVAALSAPARLEDALEKGAYDEFLARGEHRALDPRTGGRHAVGREMFRDLRARAQGADATPPADVVPAARSLAIPYLVVHGEADARVALEDARRIFFAGNVNAELEVVAGAGHDLGAGSAPDAALAPAAAAAVVRFFEKRLKGPAT